MCEIDKFMILSMLESPLTCLRDVVLVYMMNLSSMHIDHAIPPLDFYLWGTM